MAYTVNLSGNQQLTVINQGIQTLITLVSSSPGQQQSQSSSFTTGNWIAPPQLYKIASGFILQINSDRGQQFVLIQANSISTTTNPSLQNAVSVNLENTPDTPSNQNNIEFEPMKPMQPMKMGNMSMDINTMSMQMGNMSMNLKKEHKSTSTKAFCSQCGQKVQRGDRFCSSCGHKLDS
ncbi:MAG: zinc ribbon domain-containing protein [Xenococcaceae cyanobacterium MO_207.B15]|nr:zinc ribbon domain-containing protein [Xenococcaceae cyanobacterium MO_207.B15]